MNIVHIVHIVTDTLTRMATELMRATSQPTNASLKPKKHWNKSWSMKSMSTPTLTWLRHSMSMVAATDPRKSLRWFKVSEKRWTRCQLSSYYKKSEEQCSKVTLKNMISYRNSPVKKINSIQRTYRNQGPVLLSLWRRDYILTFWNGDAGKIKLSLLSYLNREFKFLAPKISKD